MNLFKKLVLVALFVSQALFAQIIETAQMTDILSSVRKKSLVVFDLDNTIMEAAQMLGSDQWFEHRLSQHLKHGLSTSDAVQATAKEWEAINTIGQVQLVEEHTPGIIETIQKRGISTMGLTARSVSFLSQSLKQLRSFDIRFDRNTVSNESFSFFDTDRAQFQEGLMIVGGNNKGKMLLSLLDKVGYRPERVVFVDDKKKNVQNVDDALLAVSIPSFAYRYGAADEKVKTFDGKLADFEFAYFEQNGVVLSDAQARKLMR